MLFYRTSKRYVIGLSLVIVILILSGCDHNTKPLEEQSLMDATPVIDTVKKLSQLNQSADELFQVMKDGNVEQSRAKVMEMEKLILSISFEGVTTLAGVVSLHQTFDRVKGAFTVTQFSEHEALLATGQLRLVTDALTHPNQPMWLQYYKILKDDVKTLSSEVTRRKTADAVVAFNKTETHFMIIKPAVTINRPSEHVVKLESVLTFIKARLSEQTVAYEQVLGAIGDLDHALDDMFWEQESPAYLPITGPGQPWIWSLGIGSFIVMMLSYAAWRMFQYEQANVTSAKRQSDKGF